MPPSGWTSTTPRVGGHGWMRQRLKHPATLLLLPFAWSAFFLLITVVPLLFPGRTADDQTVALVLFGVAWALLLLPLYIIRSKQPTSAHHRIRFRLHPFALDTFLLGVVLFILHIVIDPRIGWISYALFWIAWARTIARTGAAFESGAVRWLLPVDVANWSTSAGVTTGWSVENEAWRIGPLAYLDVDFPRGWSARLFGIERSGCSFAAFVITDRNGFLLDPFIDRLIGDMSLTEGLHEPPLSFEGEVWPERFLRSSEEE